MGTESFLPSSLPLPPPCVFGAQIHVQMCVWVSGNTHMHLHVEAVD